SVYRVGVGVSAGAIQSGETIPAVVASGEMRGRVVEREWHVRVDGGADGGLAVVGTEGRGRLVVDRACVRAGQRGTREEAGLDMLWQVHHVNVSQVGRQPLHPDDPV